MTPVITQNKKLKIKTVVKSWANPCCTGVKVLDKYKVEFVCPYGYIDSEQTDDLSILTRFDSRGHVLKM